MREFTITLSNNWKQPAKCSDFKEGMRVRRARSAGGTFAPIVGDIGTVIRDGRDGSSEVRVRFDSTGNTRCEKVGPFEWGCSFTSLDYLEPIIKPIEAGAEV